MHVLVIRNSETMLWAYFQKGEASTKTDLRCDTLLVDFAMAHAANYIML